MQIRKLIKIVLIGGGILILIIILILKFYKKITLAKSILYVLIMLGCIAGIVGIYYLRKHFATQKMPFIMKQKPLDISKAKNALLTNLVLNGYVHGRINSRTGKLLEANPKDFEFNNTRLFYGEDGIKYATIIFRLKNKDLNNDKIHLLGTHQIDIPLTNENDIINENFDLLVRRTRLQVHRDKAQFPQQITTERAPMQTVFESLDPDQLARVLATRPEIIQQPSPEQRALIEQLKEIATGQERLREAFEERRIERPERERGR